LDKKTIKRHLKYLIREGRICVVGQEKIILWDLKTFSWQVKYYFRPEFGFSKPFKNSSPRPALKRTSIHNPFIGKEY